VYKGSKLLKAARLKFIMQDLVHEASKELVDALGDKVVAVSLFGSWARREAAYDSDLDFFVVVKDLDERDRRFKIYHHLHKVVKRDVTVVDIDEDVLFREDLTITPLLLNISWDSIILYDPSGRLESLFRRIRDTVREKLERYKTKDGKYGWKPKDRQFTTIVV